MARLLASDLALALCKLAEHPEAGAENLTLERVVDAYAELHGPDGHHKNLIAIREQIPPLRTYPNKLTAHLDLERAFDDSLALQFQLLTNGVGLTEMFFRELSLSHDASDLDMSGLRHPTHGFRAVIGSVADRQYQEKNDRMAWTRRRRARQQEYNDRRTEHMDWFTPDHGLGRKGADEYAR